MRDDYKTNSMANEIPIIGAGSAYNNHRRPAEQTEDGIQQD